MSQSLLSREPVKTQGNAVSWFVVRNIREQTGQLVQPFWILLICEVCLHADILGANPFHWLLEIWYGRLFFFLFYLSNIDILLNAQCMIDSGSSKRSSYFPLWHVITLLFELWSIDSKNKRKTFHYGEALLHLRISVL